MLSSKSPGGASAFSGTTARTSRTARDFEEHIADSLLDALPDLVSASDKLLGALIPPEISETTVDRISRQLQAKNSRAQNNLLRLSAAFQVHQEVYSAGILIDISEVLKALVGSKDLRDQSGEPWRPDVLFQKANLTVLVANVLNPRVTAEAESFWHEVDQSFLRNMVRERGNFGHSTSHQASTLALEIRTQYAIMIVTRSAKLPESDLGVIVDGIFGEPSRLRGWNLVGLSAGTLPTDFEEAVLQRQEEFRHILQKFANETDIVTSLATAFPWTRFSCDIMEWASGRLKDIGATVSAAGGVEGIVKRLSDEVQKRKELLSSTPEDDGIRAASPEVELDYDLPSKKAHTTSESTRDTPDMRSRGQELNLGLFRYDSWLNLVSMKRQWELFC